MANSTSPDRLIEARFRLERGRSSSAKSSPKFSLDVDLKIPGRGITAIYGQSGCGKTTLLRCIAGLEKAEQGHLIVNGESWQSSIEFVPTHKRSIGYVFQESSLFPHLTAQGNLEFAVKRSNQKVTKAFYDRAIEIMGIDQLLKQRPQHLSGGERQRVAIARALLMQPQLLLMDEPLASLDFARKQEIMPYLERLHTSFDIPVLYVSHSMDEVARLADHAVILDQGKVVTDGKLTDVFSRIDLPFKLGDDTGVVLSGRALERDPKWHLTRFVFDGGELLVREGVDSPNQDIRVRVLARDVSIALTNHQDSSILNRLEAEVVEISPQDESMALVRLRVGRSYIISRLTLRSVDLLGLKPEMQVWVQIKSAAIVR